MIYALLTLVACASTGQAAGKNPYPEAHPRAGVQPKRPAGYKPYHYPFSPKQLLEKYGPEMRRLARVAWEDIEKANAEGPFKNNPESLATHPCPEWFLDAKIGMFIDWGPWSVGAYSTPAEQASYPDWYEQRIHDTEEMKHYHEQAWGADIGNDDLINLLSDERFDVPGFVRLAKECGFRYVVPFLKHHGGFCLWDSSFTRRDSMHWAFHRDFAAELAKQCRKDGLKFGAYVSVGEWDYPAVLADGTVGAFGFDGKLRPNVDVSGLHFISGKIPVEDYARDYLIPATKELIDKTSPDILWYDGAWSNTAEGYRTLDLNAYFYNKAAREKHAVCINDRSGSDYRDGAVVHTSDFTTSEYGAGASALVAAWEECRSFSHNFGYNWTEETDPKAILSDKECIDLIVDVVGRGGNLLLIVSPTGSGEIPPRQLHAIRNMGDWLAKYGEAVYRTRAYKLERQPEWGRITHSRDGRTVYLMITHPPSGGRLDVPPIAIKAIHGATVIHGNGAPGFTQPGKEGFSLDLSACTLGDARVSVVKLEVEPD